MLLLSYITVEKLAYFSIVLGKYFRYKYLNVSILTAAAVLILTATPQKTGLDHRFSLLEVIFDISKEPNQNPFIYN